MPLNQHTTTQNNFYNLLQNKKKSQEECINNFNRDQYHYIAGKAIFSSKVQFLFISFFMRLLQTYLHSFLKCILLNSQLFHLYSKALIKKKKKYQVSSNLTTVFKNFISNYKSHSLSKTKLKKRDKKYFSINSEN